MIGVRGLELEALPCDAPLQIIASSWESNSPSTDMQIAGFGANILLAVAFSALNVIRPAFVKRGLMEV